VDELAIKDLARLAGVTSRTLRHYEQVGLLLPTRVGYNGYRYYGEAEVARLYRILSLREFGMPLDEIKAVLDGETDIATALAEHRQLLGEQLAKLTARIAMLDETIRNQQLGKHMDIKTIFATLDPAVHEQEVRERWGDAAWEESQSRRAGQDSASQEAEMRGSVAVNQALRQAAEDGIHPNSEQFQQLVANHFAWVGDQWGGTKPIKEAYLGLADMYVADDRFAQFYGGIQNAKLITAAIKAWASDNL